MRRFIALLTVLLIAISQSSATDAILKKRASLRGDPSSTHAPIMSLSPPDDLELIDSSPNRGYYHVRTSDGQEGWVYGRSLEILSQPGGASSGATTGGSATTSDSGVSTSAAIPQDWDKPAPADGQFETADGVCGPSGDGGDTYTNLRKNRTDSPASYHLVTWKVLQSLPYPVAGRSLANWTQDQLKVIQPYEGIPVTVVGYLVKIKVEGAESTNCHFTNPEEVDWHMPLVEQAGQSEATAIVVETTPRVRQSHPKWTTTALASWVNSDSPVRISGWALLDPEHRAHLGRYRSTLWEIHPITKIEVFSNGQWVDLDDLP